MAKPGAGSHGAGPDDDAGSVEQGLLPQAAAPLHTRDHQALSGKGMAKGVWVLGGQYADAECLNILCAVWSWG